MWLLGSREEDLSRFSWSSLDPAPGLAFTEVPWSHLIFCREEFEFIISLILTFYETVESLPATISLHPQISAQPWLGQFWSFYHGSRSTGSPSGCMQTWETQSTIAGWEVERTAGYLEASRALQWYPENLTLILWYLGSFIDIWFFLQKFHSELCSLRERLFSNTMSEIMKY